MTLTFNIEYRTDWGENVRIVGSAKELGKWDYSNSFPLKTTDGIHWSATLNINSENNEPIKYTYCIYKDEAVVRKEWDTFPRVISNNNDDKKVYQIYDDWKDIPKNQSFYSSAFTECLLKRTEKTTPLLYHKQSIRIKASCPRLSSNYALAISGNQVSLGTWDIGKVSILNDENFPEWQIDIDADKLTFPLEYKFVLYNLKSKKVEAWEQNPNRYIPNLNIQENETIVISDQYVHFNIPEWKGAGMAIPVFSLKSRESFGIGDFEDLKKIIDWAAKTDQKIVQILPINDTTMMHTWMDSYPYNSISIYALHPLYLNLKKLGKLEDQNKSIYFAEKQKILNSYPSMNYEEVNQVKWEYFRVMFKQEGEKVLHSEEFKNFFETNKNWLQPYAAYSYLRDTYHTADFRQWPEYTIYNSQEVELLCSPESTNFYSIAIYYYIQYNLHLQLKEARNYARTKGIVLKGDIPIGINRNSVEAWTEPHYFNLNGQAGAPPDDFSINGQNWGFPTYNWDNMEQDGYEWWMKRFKKMAEYFDAYRIDHILGFFRIWEIPTHSVHGLLGQFVPSLPMSKEEIENYGLHFDENLFLNPYIHEHLLHQLFGPYVDLVKKQFIHPSGIKDMYELYPEYNTQRKVEHYFKEKEDEQNIWIRDGLYTLISNVLFVRDIKDANKYHPRIGVQRDYIFQTLNEKDRTAFDNLYNHYFFYRHNDFWRQQAMKKLPKLTQSTKMLVCGEDLGMIPACVPIVMHTLQILSLEIQRMPKDPSEEFGPLNKNPYQSVCTFSTHDMSTLRGWWQENYSQTQRYFNQVLGHYGTAPTVATGNICEEVIRQHLYSSSMLCIISFQDWLAIDDKLRNPDIEAERINIPANPKHYWRYRMHLTIEELMEADNLNDKIRNLINLTGRNPQI